MKLFKPNEKVMSQLDKLTKDNAKQWYKEYLKYHKGVDQGIFYMIGYFNDISKRTMLQNEFSLLRPN